MNNLTSLQNRLVQANNQPANIPANIFAARMLKSRLNLIQNVRTAVQRLVYAQAQTTQTQNAVLELSRRVTMIPNSSSCSQQEVHLSGALVKQMEATEQELLKLQEICEALSVEWSS